MKKTTIICDICHREINVRGWEDKPEPLKVHTFCTSQNPMARISGEHQTNTFDAEDVCQPCQRRIADAVSTTILAIRNPELR